VPQVPGVVLTYNRLLMVTSHIVPFHSVSIEVVEDGHTSLVSLPSVRLGSAAPSSVGPVVELISAVGRGHLHLVSRPEPTIDQLWEELRLVAAVKVAFPSRSPEEASAAEMPLHPVVLGLRLKGDKVHAPLPAVVSGIEPIPVSVPNLRSGVVQPAEVVVFAAKLPKSVQTCSLPTEDGISEAKSSTTIVKTATVVWEQLVHSLWSKDIGEAAPTSHGASREPADDVAEEAKLCVCNQWEKENQG